MKKLPLMLFLALLGFLVGSELDRTFSPKPAPLVRVGEHLVGARYSSESKLLAGVGPCKGGGWALEVWNLKGKLLCRVQGLPAPPGRYPSLVWLAGGKEVAVAAGREVWLVSADSGRKHVLKAAENVRQLEQAQGVLVARCDQEIDIWEKPNSGKRWALKAAHLVQIGLDPTGTFLAICCYQDGVRLFHLKSKRQFQHLETGLTVTGPAFSRGGDYLTYGLRQKNRRLDRVLTYSLSKNRPVGQALSTPELQGFSVDQAGRRAVASGRTHTVWDLESGTPSSEVPFAGRLISALSPDGSWTLSVPDKTTEAVLWSTADPDTQFALEHTPRCSDISFAAAGEFVTVSEGRATVWSMH